MNLSSEDLQTSSRGGVYSKVQGMLGAPADGVIGDGTTAAIRSYQQQSGLPVTGTMTLMTMQSLAGA